MNENLDLRNRIIKMRESNNLIFGEVDSVSSKVKAVPDNIKNNSKLADSGVANKKNDIFPKTNSQIDEENIDKSLDKGNKRILQNSQTFKKKQLTTGLQIKNNSNKQDFNVMIDNNEAQFRMIANKFNEAVEVILELSEKVNKLESSVYKTKSSQKKVNRLQFYFSYKIYIALLLMGLFIVSIINIPINISLINGIIIDIMKSI